MRIIFRTYFLFPLLLILFHANPLYAGLNGEVRWSLNDLPKKIDNLDWRSLDRWYILTHLFETIITFDLSQNVTSGIAGSWQVSDDRLHYIFKIRKDAKFSNGKDITSSDAIFSLKRYLLQQKKNNIFKNSIMGIKKLNQLSDNIEGLEFINEKEFGIKLNFSLENIWSFLAQPQIGGIVSIDSIDTKTLIMKDDFVSSGPYKLSEKSDSQIILAVNTHHHSYDKGMPESIVLLKHNSIDESVDWFKKGKTNFYSILSPFQNPGSEYIDAKNSIEYPYHPYHRVGFLYLNRNNKFLSDIKVRRLIASNLSSEYFTVYNNKLLSWDNNFFPPGSPGYLTKLKSFEKNGQYSLDEPIFLTIIVEPELRNSRFLNIVAERLKKANITVNFEYLNKIQISKRFSTGHFDAGIISLGLPMSDHSFGAYVYFVEQPAYLADLTGSIRDSFYQIIKTTDIMKKKTLLQSSSEQIHNDAVVIPLYHTAVKYFLGDDLYIKNNSHFKIDIQLGNLRIKK